MREYHNDRLCTNYSISISFVLPDIDECLNRNHACDVTANCTNTEGSHNCTCKEGYTGDGNSCQGIIITWDLANGRMKFPTNKKNYFFKNSGIWCLSLPSDVLAIHFCSQMSMSVAMATMFAISIRTVTTQMVLTFVLARKDTLEMDSHVKVNKSSPHYLKQAALHINYRPWKLALILEACFHAPLSYCYCVTSYTSLMLLDIDECSNGSHDCDVNANCTNTNGSHSCSCKEGYTGKGESCQGKIRLDLEKSRITVHHKLLSCYPTNWLRLSFALFSYPLQIYRVHRYWWMQRW